MAGLGMFTPAATLVGADPQLRPELGAVANATGTGGPDLALAHVAALGLPTCQLGVGNGDKQLSDSIRRAADKYNVRITALMTLGEGRMVWNLRDGPNTIGLVPEPTRKQRIAALRAASDLAKVCGVGAVHTHCGFIPEDPNDPSYRGVLAAIGEVAEHCGANGQTFLCETGQETPITLLRAIQDVKLDNVKVNLDLANLILYGKGEPVGALDVIGPYVRGIHAKDGLYPTDPYGLGLEVPMGQGKVRFGEAFAKLAALRYAGPVTIEREISGPKQEQDIRASISFLHGVIRKAYGSA